MTAFETPKVTAGRLTASCGRQVFCQVMNMPQATRLLSSWQHFAGDQLSSWQHPTCDQCYVKLTTSRRRPVLCQDDKQLVVWGREVNSKDNPATFAIFVFSSLFKMRGWGEVKALARDQSLALFCQPDKWPVVWGGEENSKLLKCQTHPIQNWFPSGVEEPPHPPYQRARRR